MFFAHVQKGRGGAQRQQEIVHFKQLAFGVTMMSPAGIQRGRAGIRTNLIVP
jgi:hypothetical protein